jgi:hypothetical protein
MFFHKNCRFLRVLNTRDQWFFDSDFLSKHQCHQFSDSEIFLQPEPEPVL